MKLPKHGFWPKVQKTSYCWIWLGFKQADGYGRFCTSTDGKQRNILAHRYSYMTLVGPIPEGTEIDHLCRNRACVRPTHLEAVPHKVNCERGDYTKSEEWKAKKRQNFFRCGHPWEGPNVYFHPTRKRKFCRACMRAAMERFKRRHQTIPV